MIITIPPSWSFVKLEEVVNCISPNDKKLKQKDYQEKGKYPVIDQGQVFIGGYSNDKNLLLDFEPPVIVFGDHTKVKKFVNFNFIVGADGVKVLKPFEFFDPKLFYYFLYCIKFVDKGYARHYQHLIKEQIPLPPLPEQHRIVAKLEELFSQLEIAVDALKKAKEQIKTYKQAVLSAAFSGKLTMDNGQLKMNEETGLPEGWKWVKLEEAAKIIMGQSPPGDTYNTDGIGIPLINGPVEFGKGALSKTIKSKFTTKPTKFCEENDLILCVRGSTTGRTNIADFKACLGRGVASIRANQCQYFLNYFIISQREIIYNAGTGSTFPNITTDKLKEILVPLPSLSEQEQIVAEIETRFSEAENLEKTIDKGLEQAESLRQRILKKAFEGRLVPQDPNDEPASVLLEKIKKDKLKIDNGQLTMKKDKK